MPEDKYKHSSKTRGLQRVVKRVTIAVVLNTVNYLFHLK